LGFPALDEDQGGSSARVWLRGREPSPAPEAAPKASGSLEVQVDRLVVDSQPMTLKTRWRLIVAGPDREASVEGFELPGTTPTRLESPLPARLAGGELRIQVSAGVHDVFIDSRLRGPANELGPASGLFGPERWAFVRQPHLRQVEVSGAPQIDQSLVDVRWAQPPVAALEPGALDSWPGLMREYTIYEVSQGESLKFDEIRRGDPEPGPDMLDLSRRCWLDYDGRGLTCRDRLEGYMRRQWHLSVDEPFVLGQASLDG
jgi:hypothetical protein